MYLIIESCPPNLPALLEQCGSNLIFHSIEYFPSGRLSDHINYRSKLGSLGNSSNASESSNPGETVSPSYS